jgi:hypothetical protein
VSVYMHKNVYTWLKNEIGRDLSQCVVFSGICHKIKGIISYHNHRSYWVDISISSYTDMYVMCPEVQ